MRLFDNSDYSRGARVYWWITTLAGSAALSWAIWQAFRLDGASPLELAALVGIVFLGGLYPIRIRGTQDVVTAGDIFIFLAMISMGPAAATLLGASDAITASWRLSRRLTSRLGGPAIMAISVFVSAHLFKMALTGLEHVGLLTTATLLATLLLISLVQFVLNTMLLAGHNALKQKVPLFRVWWFNYAWISLTSAASASAAGLLYLALGRHGFISLLAAGPLFAVIFATCYFYFKQADERAKSSERISNLHLATVEALAVAINAKDEVTSDHVYRVQVYACGLARHFKLSDPEIEALKAGALLHDVGKIAVPDYVLNKPGKLTAAEFEKMKIHTIVGAQILERVNFPYPVVPIVRHHHERWDGRGYPDGLAKEAIPMTARILAVVDCYDAVREDRQYRRGLTRDEACRLLSEGAASQFDPNVVEAFLANLPAYEEEIAKHRESQFPALPNTSSVLPTSARSAAPAAGLATSTPAVPDYVKQINAAHAEMAALYEMAQTFSASLDLRDVISITVNHLERLIPFNTCVVYIRQSGDDSIVAAHVFGDDAEQIRGRSIKAGYGIAGWVVINGRPMANTDPALDLGETITAEAGFKTAAVFPLSGQSEPLGAIALYTRNADSYNPEQLQLLESVTRLTSSALQRALLYEETRESAYTDALTGLPNGRSLYARFEHEIATAREEETPLTVLSLSLFGLREVNDAFGYRVGDRMMIEVARVLRAVVAGRGFLSRVAGDQFICLLQGCDTREATNLGQEAKSRVGELELPVRPHQVARVGLGSGVAQYPQDGQTVDELLQAASIEASKNKIDHEIPAFELPREAAIPASL